MKVYKFGGSSVGTPDRIKSIIELIAAQAQRENVRAVVFSAFQGVTDQLIETANLAAAGRADYTDHLKTIENRHLDAVRALIDIHHQSNTMAVIKMMLNDLDDILQGVFLIKELSPRSRDFILSFGERLSNLIISRALVSAGHDCEFLDARKLIKTDAGFGNALVLQDETHQNIRAWFQEHPLLQIVTGFIASTLKDETTTLGRGGSDYTASILGAALDAEEVQIWTDVDGVLTADPRKVTRAFPVPAITYEEAMEMSHFGAKVIYPPTIQPLMTRGIPIRIKNTFNPSGNGTLITADADPGEYAIRGISSINDVSLVRLQGTGMVGVAGVARRIFGTMARNSINVILISQASSEYSVCFAVRPEDAHRAQSLLAEEFAPEIERKHINEISIESGLCIVAVVGENMRATPGIAGKVFQALGQNGVNISAIAQGSSELNISMVIQQEDEKKALSAIHDAFFLAGLKTVHVFMVGVGLIGRTLIDMISRQRRHLGDDRHLDVRVIGIANSRKMYFDLNGIPESGWMETLEKNGGPMDLDTYLDHVLSLNLPNSVLVDCTSNELVSNRYLDLLDRSVSVVTPNKKAASGPYTYYQELRAAALRNNVHYLYETNVGAGLPVIRTVRDFREAGDPIRRIEGVLSGTISYLLNTFEPGMKFSESVKKAREMGYTEPDPRDDLNGMDVARKILILARESGLHLEIGDVVVDPVLPAEYFVDEPVDAFMARLSGVDAYMEDRAKKAAADGRKLRYIARVEEGRAEVRLMEVGAEHPAYALTASDNLVMVNSDCYSNRPLVVMGPGAGPEVTASGVLSDIIKAS